MTDDELVRLDYEQTTQVVGALTEVRFKLLAFVPTIAGAAVAFLSDDGDASVLLAVGLLGLVATLGIFVYELRNTQLYRAATDRAKVLERRLGIRSTLDETRTGGVYAERPREPLRLLGRAEAWHDRGVALVYAAALAGWTYLVTWGALALIGVPGADTAGALLAVAAGVLVVYEATRRGRTAGAQEAPSPDREGDAPGSEGRR